MSEKNPLLLTRVLNLERNDNLMMLDFSNKKTDSNYKSFYSGDKEHLKMFPSYDTSHKAKERKIRSR